MAWDSGWTGVVSGLLVAGLLLVALLGYGYGRRAQRAVILGRDTYVRFYPNPGVGVRIGNRRVAASVVRGVELFVGRPVAPPVPPGILSGGDRLWVRTHAFWARRWPREMKAPREG